MTRRHMVDQGKLSYQSLTVHVRLMTADDGRPPLIQVTTSPSTAMRVTGVWGRRTDPGTVVEIEAPTWNEADGAGDTANS